MSSEKTLFLLDAFALIYRAHFAFTKNPRINSKGRNTSVPFGFTNTLLEVLQKQKPTHIGVAFDTSAPTFRDEMFEEYKANRQETPEDIRYGTPIIKDILKGFNIPILELDGYEADDLIGTLAIQAAKKGFKVYMMTPDKDFGQIVGENIWLYKPAFMGNSVDILGEKEVCEKWDIENVSQVVDMLGLQGDTADNIPGIPGFGPKTAAALLKEFGSVENIIAGSSKLKGRQKELVEKYAEQAILSKKLAAINTEAPVEFNEKDLEYSGPDLAKIKTIFDELEFRSMLTRVTGNGKAEPAETKQAQLSMFGSAEAAEGEGETISDQRTAKSSGATYTIADTDTERKALAGKLKEAGNFSIEITSKGDSNFDSVITGIAFSWTAGEATYVPVKEGHDAETILKLFLSLLSDNKVRITGQNLKPAVILFKKLGVTLSSDLFDTMLAHYLIEPEASHELNAISGLYASYKMMGLDEAPAAEIACERADISLQIRGALESELEKRGHSRLMKFVELPLMRVLADMEFEGVMIDQKALEKMSEALKKDLESVQAEIFKLAGTTFNLNSPRQLGEILFEKMQLADKAKKTKTGQYATGEEVLVKLAGEHEIIRHILEFREYDKLRSTYMEALPKMASKSDHRIHTDYRQAVAATGRLSSNNPNLQNIPVRTEKGKQIRKAFVPRGKDFLFMSADYSQIELRIAAVFAQDETMMDAFRHGRDIHRTTAAKVFKVDQDKVTADMRRKAKEVNFGILYGSSAFGLSQNLGISRTEAAALIDNYFNEFPGIKKYMDDSINHAREKEYVETILGRRRYLRDINSRNITTRGFAERNAINAPIQGSAADIIKVAMIHIHNWLNREQLKTRMILQVHDELVFDVHKDEADDVKEKVIDLMTNAIQLEVP
ncbi:MAG: DNA polymerase I, partial [Cyclobacteriaceae bacterium]